jgi:hypothetical protein
MNNDASHDSRKSEAPPAASTAASNGDTDSNNGIQTNEGDSLKTCTVKDETPLVLGDAYPSSRGNNENDLPESPRIQCENASSPDDHADSGENGGADEDTTATHADNDDNRADVANVLLGLMRR